MFILIVLLGFAFAMLIEYSMHRFILHSSLDKNNIHISTHHKIFDNLHFSSNTASNHDVLPSFKYIISNILFLVPFSIFLSIIISIQIGFIFLLSGSVYIALGLYIHLKIHIPEGKYIEQTGLFKELKKNHALHHKDHGVNFGFATQVIDVIMNTYQKS